MDELWNGFKKIEFEFEGMQAILVFPKVDNQKNICMLKTEYFGAFPSFELEMLGRGYHLTYLANKTRWCLDEDLDRKHRFIKFLSKEYGISQRVIPVGMSCGGMIAIKFAARYPQHISAMFIDAPVINLLSCPAGLGKANSNMFTEFENATGMTLADLISYRNHPLDNIDKLIDHKIPICAVCGDSDDVVPYEENGALLYEKYKDTDAPYKFVIVPGRGHHPHGLDDNSEIIEFIEKFI